MSATDWGSRTSLILGDAACLKLQNAHVLVAGAGGVGGIAIEMLARAGVGEMTILDGDRVDVTNRNRQLVALVSTVGRYKTEAWAVRLRDINPEIKLHLHNRYFTAEDMEQILAAASYDCVLDAIDTVAPKTALLAACVRNHIPVVSCMGAGAKMDPEAVKSDDISKTIMCPLARVIRTNLKKLGITRGIRAVYSTEKALEHAVVPSDDCGQNKKSITGTISFMPNIFGCHCASEVIKLLTKDVY